MSEQVGFSNYDPVFHARQGRMLEGAQVKAMAREPVIVTLISRLEQVTERAREMKMLAEGVRDGLLGTPSSPLTEGKPGLPERSGVMGDIIDRVETLDWIVDQTVKALRHVQEETRV